MNTHDMIELPQGYTERPFDYSGDLYTEGQMRAAIEADRKRRGEPVACFKCGHAKHGGECVNVAPQPAAPMASPAQPDDFDAQQRRIEKSMRAGARMTDHRFKLDTPQPAEPSDSLPRHVAQTLATAIYETAQKMGIANGDHSALSVPQCLHLLDCMTQPAEPVTVPETVASDNPEPVAWLHEDDPARVMSAVRMATITRDGAESALAVRAYSIPLYATPQPAAPVTPTDIKQLIYDLAQEAGAARYPSLSETQIDSLCFDPASFERFCERLLEMETT